ncbi:LysR family transcriptional regulator [Vibrio parahaemolyticus]|uniref:LysR family transcriptional regulator n=1 Tax=Vibrio parahaemolyticus TaxID=670 RepID=UPI00084B0782|nr:LysR family transcriptional regulator [Vibrio parahaemolyticus]EHH1097311.1 LysR family transcriptional regulator [Vibrio parahaemolyticus]EHH3742208.1 LysR family transcriptional regulator [Vibrio parahaemolyticus]EHR1137001.1 LysR family transcriptional regulator [Vibrio parahaemolyticus]EHR6437553.1 LysR family transcriptional regulator [Vibrio parahaemolyticus]EHR6585612.1 LysR family transcriptional regulator [Vibrio parahaemolyticus]
MNTSYQLLPILIAIIEEKNLSRVALRMNVSQPTISRTLSILREEYKDPLVVRTATGVEPTIFAQQIYPSLLKGLNVLNSTFATNVTFDPHARPYRFSIACNSFVNYSLVPKIIEKFSHNYPLIVVGIQQIESTDIVASLRNKECDFLIDMDIAQARSLNKKKIYQDKLVLCCGKKHPRIQSDSITKQQFLAEKHITVSKWGTHSNTFTDEQIKGFDARKIGAVTSGTIESLCLAGKTDFVCLADKTNVDIFKHLFSIKSVQLPFENIDYDICLYWHPTRNDDLAIRWFRKEIEEIALEHYS